MEQAEAEALRERLETLIRERWAQKDADGVVTGHVSDDGKIDLTVVSRLFEGRDGLEREAFFWPVFDPVPKEDLLHMTYCLLLTPDEAARHFASPGPPVGVSNTDAWDE